LRRRIHRFPGSSGFLVFDNKSFGHSARSHFVKVKVAKDWLLKRIDLKYQAAMVILPDNLK